MTTLLTPTARNSVIGRPTVSVEMVAFTASLVFVLGANRGFLDLFLAGRNWNTSYAWVFAAASTTFLVMLHFIVLALLLNRWTAKPVLTLLFAATPGAVYFMRSYGVIYDTDMMRNILHTTPKEAGELFTPGLMGDVVMLGVLPIALLWWVKIAPAPFGAALRRRTTWLAGAMVVLVATGVPFSKDLFSTARNHHELNHMLIPASVVVGSVKALINDGVAATRTRVAIGLDAKVVPPAATGRKPKLLVVVVGETARAANWGLNGYARQTTPELAAIPGLINFDKVTSCGTATEVSVPCMFSAIGRRHYDEDAIRSQQSLLHVLDHAGVAVLWRDNQTGCKGVCADLPTDQLDAVDDPRFCADGQCRDDILLAGLGAKIDATTGDMVVTLHQLGNHGPSYYQRYPSAYRRFTPTCDTAELGNCPAEAVVNTYDNALLYTDHVLAETISFLASRTDRDTGLIYVSDHGESLGEYGLFLHGVPYPIAPSEQTHVPMVMWLSDGLAASLAVDRSCLTVRAGEPASHDDLFHTVLGVMGVSTSLYDRGLDLTAGCRGPGGAAAS